MRYFKGLAILSVTFIFGIFYFSACEQNLNSGIEESLQTVPKVTPIKGAQDIGARVNEGDDSYFTVEFENIIPNEYIDNSEREAWCIVYDKPISSDGNLQEGLSISYADGEEWEPIRRLLGMKDALLSNDPDITYREIQAAIWTLRDFPEFDLDNITVDEVPSRMVNNGTFNFDKEKVRDIIEVATTPSSSSSSSKLRAALSSEEEDQTKEICVIETDSDTQTVIVPCGDTFWAYGEISFRQNYDNGQWGWVYTFSSKDENPASTPLIAGAGEDDGTYSAEDLMDHWVGELNVSLDSESDPEELTVTYSADGENEFSIAHLWVGCDYETELPTAGNNNVPPGQLPFSYVADEGEFFTEYTFTLTIGSENDFDNRQIAQCPNDEYQIAAHGVVGED